MPPCPQRAMIWFCRAQIKSSLTNRGTYISQTAVRLEKRAYTAPVDRCFVSQQHKLINYYSLWHTKHLHTLGVWRRHRTASSYLWQRPWRTESSGTSNGRVERITAVCSFNYRDVLARVRWRAIIKDHCMSRTMMFQEAHEKELSML